MTPRRPGAVINPGEYKRKQCVDGGDCENNLYIVKMESALRIIATLASFAGNENSETAWRIIAAIKKEATEVLR